MEIETSINKVIRYTNGYEIKKGDVVILKVGEKNVAGKFDGFTKHGALSFICLTNNEVFNILPRSIEGAYHAEVVLID